MMDRQHPTPPHDGLDEFGNPLIAPVIRRGYAPIRRDVDEHLCVEYCGWRWSVAHLAGVRSGASVYCRQFGPPNKNPAWGWWRRGAQPTMRAPKSTRSDS